MVVFEVSSRIEVGNVSSGVGGDGRNVGNSLQ